MNGTQDREDCELFSTNTFTAIQKSPSKNPSKARYKMPHVHYPERVHL